MCRCPDRSRRGGSPPSRPVSSFTWGSRSTWEAFIENYNVAVRHPGERKRTLLSADGSEGNYYDLASVAWSPDSSRLAAYRIRPGYRRYVHYVESSPEDQLQPRSWTLLYAKPGDTLTGPTRFTPPSRGLMSIGLTLPLRSRCPRSQEKVSR